MTVDGVKIPDLHDFDEISAKVKRSPRALREAANRGEFEHIKIGKQHFLTTEQLLVMIEESKRRRAIPADDGLNATRERVARTRARRSRADSSGRQKAA